MRGWERVGRLAPTFDPWSKWHALDERTDIAVTHGDIIAVSPNADGPLRVGLIRVDKCDSNLRVPDYLNNHIYAATGGDYVFVATALGEHAFKPSTPAASD